MHIPEKATSLKKKNKNIPESFPAPAAVSPEQEVLTPAAA